MQKLQDILLTDGINPPIVLAVACGSVTVVVLWKWVIRREIQRKMKEARQWRNGSLEQMEKVAWKLKQKVAASWDGEDGGVFVLWRALLNVNFAAFSKTFEPFSCLNGET